MGIKYMCLYCQALEKVRCIYFSSFSTWSSSHTKEHIRFILLLCLCFHSRRIYDTICFFHVNVIMSTYPFHPPSRFKANYLTMANVSMHKTNIPPAVNTQGGCVFIIIKRTSFFVLGDASYQFKFTLQL